MDAHILTRWTGLKAVIDSINDSDDPASAVSSMMTILLAKVRLDVGEMSDAIQTSFLHFEALSKADQVELSQAFDDHLASLRN